MDRKTALLLMPLRCVIFILTFVTAALAVGRDISEISCIWSAAVSAVNILTIALLICIAKKNGSSYKELINFNRENVSLKKVLLTAAASVVIGMACMYLSGLICYGTLMPAVSLKMIAPVPKALAVINLLILPVTTALAEDGLYLGAGVGHIGGKYAGLAVPACFYTIQHCFMPVIFDVRYMVYRALSFLPLIILFCICYRRKKEPVGIMTGHALLDLATAICIFATSVIPGVYDSFCKMTK